MNIKSVKEEAEESLSDSKNYNVLLSILFVITGIASLTYGSDILVNGTVALSEIFGISEQFISVTIVSLGTSLPEIVSCIISAIRKKPGLIIGNIVGSNIFNLCTVLGSLSLFNDIYVSYRYRVLDIPFMITSAILFYMPILLFKKIGKFTSILMFITYIIYTYLAYKFTF
jgi:cation:H+ antiporter